MVDEASPTPGKITLSDFMIISGSSVTIGEMPNRSKAKATLFIFPALYLIIAIFIILNFLSYFDKLNMTCGCHAELVEACLVCIITLL